MDLSGTNLRHHLDVIAIEGWDSVSGDKLLDAVRRDIVRPLVRGSGLRGPAADQAESTAWAAAWDALRRPTALQAGNPAGMAWVAARRAIWAEVDAAPRQPGSVEATDPEIDVTAPHGSGTGDVGGSLGPRLDRILDLCVESGWDREVVRGLSAVLAEHSGHALGVPAARWRLVARRAGVPEWQARRLAGLLLGGPGNPGVLALMVERGAEILSDESVRAAVSATTRPWGAVPEAHLSSVPPTELVPSRADRRHARGAHEVPDMPEEVGLPDMGALSTLCADAPHPRGPLVAATGGGATEPYGGRTRCSSAPGRPAARESPERP
jgi:hypothetical protein